MNNTIITRPIGEVFKKQIYHPTNMQLSVTIAKLEVVESKNCKNCWFRKQCDNSSCRNASVRAYIGHCNSDLRTDGKKVIFKFVGWQ